MNGYIITGSSRGLGKALVSEILTNGDWAFSLSRSADRFEKKNINLFCDLSSTDTIWDRLNLLLSYLPSQKLKALVLINNAGVLKPIKSLHKLSANQIQQHMLVNLVAPAILTAGFISLTQNIKVNRRIINISSGAGKNAYAGWATYCSSKAGLDMLTKCVGLELEKASHPVKISSFAPGVLDTDMQIEIRQSDCKEFPHRSRFIKLKQSGNLLPPQFVAKTLLKFDQNDVFKQGKIHDIRQML